MQRLNCLLRSLLLHWAGIKPEREGSDNVLLSVLPINRAILFIFNV